MKLTDSEVKRAKAADKPWKISDGHGLFLLVQPTGGKLWRYAYRFNGQQKLLALGSYPVVTLAMAREKHLDARRQLEQNIDPSAARKAEKVTGKTFREVAEEWFDNWKANKVNAHINRVGARLKRDVYPVIGGKAIATLTAPDIVAMCRKVESRGVGETARRVYEDCNATFSYGVGHGFCERNPCADVKASDVLRPVTASNHARVSDAEIPAVVKALWNHPGIVTRMASKLTVYTALRTANVIGLEWAWVNLDAAEIRFSGDVMKTRGVPFVCVLSTHAVEALRFMHQISGNGRYVFPGHKAGQHLSNGAMLKALRDAGFGGKMTQHAWRAVFTTWAAGAGFEKDHVEAQLHHVKKGVRKHYDFQQFVPQRRELVQAWAKHLDSLAS